MAVNNRSSTFIGNRDATPAVESNAEISGGLVKEGQGYVSATNADSAGSIYRMFSVPSNARVSRLMLQCAALGAGAKVDVGVYKNVRDGGAAVDADFFATAVDVSGALGPTEVINESGTNTIDKQEMPLWQALGVAADPKSSYDIAAVVNVAIAATGFLGLKGQYI